MSSSDGSGLSKKRLIQKDKLAKLCQYGTPPVLRELQSPIVKTARRAFTAPRLVGTKRKYENDTEQQYVQPRRLMDKLKNT